MRVVVTGGAGYIGSTIVSACADAGHDVVIIDDLSEGRTEYVRDFEFYHGDIRDTDLLGAALTTGIEAVVHCAARMVVPESVADPLGYYHSNVIGTLTLARAMAEHGVDRMIFSSSASVYDAPVDGFGVDEEASTAPASPYARTKLMAEQILADAAAAAGPRAISLRYFNPIGCDPQLRTGQQRPAASHVLARMLDAWLRDDEFTITGVDWATPDGSGIRDYLHVWDLARAHVAALERFDDVVSDGRPHVVINLGRGEGVSVRELAESFEQASGTTLKVVEGPRRPGDVIGAFAVTGEAEHLLGWRTELSVVDAIRDNLRWLPRRKELLGY